MLSAVEDVKKMCHLFRSHPNLEWSVKKHQTQEMRLMKVIVIPSSFFSIHFKSIYYLMRKRFSIEVLTNFFEANEICCVKEVQFPTFLGNMDG